MKFAMIFPGQGSQRIDVLFKLSKTFPIIKNTFDEASNYINHNLWKYIKENYDNSFKNDEYIPALMLTTAVSLYYTWKKKTKKFLI
ncbi:MAG: hypothetical protein ACP2W7_01475 [Buchnera aphidicola (Tetraneura sorini)]